MTKNSFKEKQENVYRGESRKFWQNRYPSLKLTDDFLQNELEIKKAQIIHYSKNNIIVEDFNNFYIEGMSEIDNNSIIGSGVVIKGTSRIGKDVKIYPNVYIENSKIGNNSTILPGSVIIDSILKGNNKIGPNAHIRMNSVIEKNANIGNFVEMKKSVFGEGSKAMHLTYIGDSDIGKKVNIGAGTITCNYDGVNKNKTVIEDNVFIGSGTELIAPVKIGKNSYVAAGSTITSDIPVDSLGVARERQRNIDGWVSRKKNKVSKKN